MGNKVINVERDFSRYPAGRYESDGPHNGQTFREKFLVPALSARTEKVLIELDGARGYGSSFLEEAFGGLVRDGFTAEELFNLIDLKSEDNSLIEEIKGYILDESKIPRRH